MIVDSLHVFIRKTYRTSWTANYTTYTSPPARSLVTEGQHITRQLRERIERDAAYTMFKRHSEPIFEEMMMNNTVTVLCNVCRTFRLDNIGREASCPSSKLVVLLGIQIDYALKQDWHSQ